MLRTVSNSITSPLPSMVKGHLCGKLLVLKIVRCAFLFVMMASTGKHAEIKMTEGDKYATTRRKHKGKNTGDTEMTQKGMEIKTKDTIRNRTMTYALIQIKLANHN